MSKKEVFWLIGSLILAFIFNYMIYHFTKLNKISAFNLNIHDTYFVIPKYIIAFLIGNLILFCVYLIRTIKNRFNNITSNVILMISSFLLIIIFNKLGVIIESVIQQNSGWTIYPPLSSGIDIKQIELEAKLKTNTFNTISYLILIFQTLFIIFLTYCGFKTGIRFQTNKQQ